MNYNVRHFAKVFINGKEFKKLNKLLNELDNKFFFDILHLDRISYNEIKVSLNYIKEVECISFVTNKRLRIMDIKINNEVFSEKEIDMIMNIFRKYWFASTLGEINVIEVLNDE
jgi:hypothetical protein